MSKAEGEEKGKGERKCSPLAMALSTMREALAEIEEFEKRKHVTHVGFAIVAVYKDHKARKVVYVRPEGDLALCEAVGELAAQYKEITLCEAVGEIIEG